MIKLIDSIPDRFDPVYSGQPPPPKKKKFYKQMIKEKKKRCPSINERANISKLVEVSLSRRKFIKKHLHNSELNTK
ncbi:hypothetical protein V1477_007116 [Vespula maculifrons]|uniref:Uncharacterized protein n=1 Tax=Vespula maculifrons TaxID=7453 RepID=A0ABD2CI94_VESMC